jgi:hypothetical protein
MSQAEKRRHPRVNIQTSVELFDRTPRQGEWDPRPHALGRFDVLNVSVGGALIAGKVPVPVGANLGVHIHLPGTEVHFGSMLLRKGDGDNPDAFAVCFQVAAERDREAVERAISGVLGESPAPSEPLNMLPANDTKTRSPIGLVWRALRELESAHFQQCGRCHIPFALPAVDICDGCRHGQDLRSLLQSLTSVLVRRDQYPNTLRTCRALTIERLGRDLDTLTKEVLTMRLAEPAAQTLCGHRPLRRLRLQAS